MGACAVCGESFDESDLLFGPRGRTCALCLVQDEERSEQSAAHWVLLTAPPLVTVGAVMVSCLPIIGMFMGLIMGCMGLLAGLAAIQTGWRLAPDAPGVPDWMRNGLFISGGVSTALSLMTVAWCMIVLSLFVVTQVM